MIKSDTDRDFVLDPTTTEPVLLDRSDRHTIQEALLWYADEKIPDHDADAIETSEYVERLAWYVTND